MVKKTVASATATVAHCFGGYVLPDGLTEGEIVRLLEFDHGHYNVECRDGRRFHVAENCVEPVPSEFYANHRAETFLKRMRALFRPSEGRARLTISTSFKYLRFAVFGDDNKPRSFTKAHHTSSLVAPLRGSLEIHKDAILNLGSEFRERIGRRLLALRARPYRA
jgi:hypothetical protein